MVLYWGTEPFENDIAMDFVAHGEIDRWEQMLDNYLLPRKNCILREYDVVKSIAILKMMQVVCSECFIIPPKPEKISRYKQILLDYIEKAMNQDTKKRKKVITTICNRLLKHSQYWYDGVTL